VEDRILFHSKSK